MRGGDVTMAPEQQAQPQPVSSTPSWFSNFATRIKSAANNLTAKLRNIKWSGTTAENPTPPTVQQQEPMAQQQQPNNLFQNVGEKVQVGFGDATKKLEEGYEKTKNTVGDFFNKDVGAGIGESEVKVEGDNQNGGRKPRKITKKRRMRGGFAAYNEYTVAQTASPVEGIKTAEPTYMINASLTNSLNGGKKRKTKRKRQSKRRKTRGKNIKHAI